MRHEHHALILRSDATHRVSKDLFSLEPRTRSGARSRLRAYGANTTPSS